MDTSITMENVNAFRQAYEANPMSKAMTKAASKAAVNDSC